MGISQSGKSPDIVAVLAEAQRQGALTAALTNEPESDLSQAADHVIPLHAGKEESVAATKTYSAELAAVAMLSTALKDDARMAAELDHVPDMVAQALTVPNQIERVAERYSYVRQCVVIGRGYNYCTAFEMALKIKELTYTVVQPYSSADFLHGPLAIIDPGFPVFVIAPSGMMADDMRAFCATAGERGAELTVISDDQDLLAEARIPLVLPSGTPEWLSPITAIVPGQLFAAHLARARGYDPDRPRALRKVTETL
jgi:glucosamine--fructose-6-phosphate aminotransferase (isomerizing)